VYTRDQAISVASTNNPNLQRGAAAPSTVAQAKLAAA
jgi:hypothetical protein